MKAIGRTPISGKTYWFAKADGHMFTDWKKLNRKWYFFGSDGSMRKGGWTKTGGSWYYMESDGSMARGWKYVNGKTYRLHKSKGYMLTDWQYVDYRWYYFGSDGARREYCWVGYYWLDGSGALAKNSWVDGNSYYVGPNGKWVKIQGTYRNGTRTITLTGYKSGTYTVRSSSGSYISSGRWSYDSMSSKTSMRLWMQNPGYTCGSRAYLSIPTGSSKTLYLDAPSRVMKNDYGSYLHKSLYA